MREIYNSLNNRYPNIKFKIIISNSNYFELELDMNILTQKLMEDCLPHFSMDDYFWENKSFCFSFGEEEQVEVQVRNELLKYFNYMSHLPGFNPGNYYETYKDKL